MKKQNNTDAHNYQHNRENDNNRINDGRNKRWNGYQGYDGGLGSDGEFKKTWKPQRQKLCRLWRKQK